jgi:alanine racemase
LAFGRLKARFSRPLPASAGTSASGRLGLPAPNHATATLGVASRLEHESTTAKPVVPAPERAVPTPDLPEPSQVETSGPAAFEAGGILTIDLTAIVKNWKALAKRVVPASCAAVVKSDAYGCGVDQVAAALAKAGCATFFVAHLAEARQVRAAVRAAAPGAVIYVLNGFPPGTAPSFAEINAQPVIGSLAEFVEWDAYRTATRWAGGAALHFDTGMNRLGFPLADAPLFTARVKMADHGITLVMSHLACADTPGHPLNAKQIAAFRDLRFMFRGTPTSLANSSGIFLGNAAHCDMVRPGAALFGVNPTPATPNLMEPVVALKARIVQVRDVARGETVGYGATWIAGRASRIAIVSVGYGDGYPRAANDPSGRAKPEAKSGARSGPVALIAGRRCPIVGRISMDLMALDVTALPEDPVRRGAEATLIGNGISVDDVAAWSGTIGYEVLTSLGRRYRREWQR